MSTSFHWELMRGRVIAFEGPDGCGKTTQVSFVEQAAQAAGVPVVRFREPGGTPLGERIRGILMDRDATTDIDPLADVLLFTAARQQLWATKICSALQERNLVLLDRTWMSTVVYQKFDAQTLYSLHGLLKAPRRYDPDLTIILSVPAEVAVDRLLARQKPFAEPIPRTEDTGDPDRMHESYKRKDAK